MARAHELKNENTDAIKYLVHALSLASDKDTYENMGPSIHFSLGKLYMKEGLTFINLRNINTFSFLASFGQAVKQFNRVLELKPTDEHLVLKTHILLAQVSQYLIQTITILLFLVFGKARSQD